MRLRHGLGFVVFCLISGSRWMVESAFPSTLPTLLEQALHYGLIGIVALAWWLLQRRPAEHDPAPWPQLAAASLLVCAPAAMIDAAHVVSSVTAVALFAMTPLVIVLGVASSGSGEGGRALMTPALIGLGGTLLLLGFQPPSTVHAGLMLAIVFGAVVLTSGGSIWIHTLLHHRNIAHAAAVLCGANAVLLGIAAVVHGLVPLPAGSLPLELLRTLAFDLPLIVLFVWLLRELPAARFASRYLIAPLFAVLEEAIFLRLPMNRIMVSGMLLMAVGGVALLLMKDVDEAEKTSQLGLN